jgi:hypothetical protein
MEAAFEAAGRVVATRPRTAAATVSSAAAALVNAYREKADPAMDGWISALASHFAAFELLFREARPESDSESGAEGLLEDVRTELRLAREARERRERDAQRRLEEEQRRLDREARERQQEEQRRELERQQQARALAQREAEAKAVALTARGSAAGVKATAPERPPGALQPGIPPEPIDSEPLLPGTPLPTLVDYVRFMKELSAGVDVLQLFSSRGLTAQSWSVLVSGWSAILGGRLEVVLRFGRLMAAPWA